MSTLWKVKFGDDWWIWGHSGPWLWEKTRSSKKLGKKKNLVFFSKKIEWPLIRKRSLPERNGAQFGIPPQCQTNFAKCSWPGWQVAKKGFVFESCVDFLRTKQSQQPEKKHSLFCPLLLYKIVTAFEWPSGLLLKVWVVQQLRGDSINQR